MAETMKAYPRRKREGWFRRFLVGSGIDVGCSTDPVTTDCVQWDQRFGHDAYYLDGEYDWVYSSHCLEHLSDPEAALRNWWEHLKRGGVLIVCVPHRDLYEMRRDLPSRWNADHKHFWLPVASDREGTRGLLETVMAAIPDARLERLSVEDEGWEAVPENTHAHGEYQIEIVVRKPGGASQCEHRAAP